MEPFNIKLNYGAREITLTILPTKKGLYKVIYYGGILGGVVLDHDEWTLIHPDQMTAEVLPFYESGKIGERMEIELTEYVVERIGAEITQYLEDQEI